MSIYLEDERLYFQQYFPLPIELLYEGEDQFFHVFHDGNELKIGFEHDIRGAVNGVAGVLFGEESHLERLNPAQPDVPLPVTGGSVGTIAWGSWALAALGAITIAAAVRQTRLLTTPRKISPKLGSVTT